MKYIMLYEEATRGLDKKFIWIHGLPGSGKSHLANLLASREEGKIKVLDDVASINEVEQNILEHDVVIFSSPYFEEYVGLRGLPQKLMELLKGLGIKLKELWFENDPEACIKNLLRRGDNHMITADILIPEIMDFSTRYKIPKGSATIPVWNDEV